MQSIIFITEMLDVKSQGDFTEGALKTTNGRQMTFSGK